MTLDVSARLDPTPPPLVHEQMKEAAEHFPMPAEIVSTFILASRCFGKPSLEWIFETLSVFAKSEQKDGI